MKKNLFIWQIIGICFTAVLGTVLHFLYQWTKVRTIAWASAINESTWEHMKLLFIPSLLFAIVQSFWAKDDLCFWPAKLIGITIGVALIPVLFYTLSGIFGKLPSVVNVSIFFVSVIAQYGVEYLLYPKLTCSTPLKWLAVVALLFLLSLFVVFSYYPPKLPLFQDPITNGYGITK